MRVAVAVAFLIPSSSNSSSKRRVLRVASHAASIARPASRGWRRGAGKPCTDRRQKRSHVGVAPVTMTSVAPTYAYASLQPAWNTARLALLCSHPVTYARFERRHIIAVRDAVADSQQVPHTHTHTRRYRSSDVVDCMLLLPARLSMQCPRPKVAAAGGRWPQRE